MILHFLWFISSFFRQQVQQILKKKINIEMKTNTKRTITIVFGMIAPKYSLSTDI